MWARSQSRKVVPAQAAVHRRSEMGFFDASRVVHAGRALANLNRTKGNPSRLPEEVLAQIQQKQ